MEMWAVFSGFYITIMIFTRVKVILRSITDRSRPSHHCRRITSGLDRGHCRQLTHEKDSALLLDESWTVHKPRVEANTRNSASVPLKRKATWYQNMLWCARATLNQTEQKSKDITDWRFRGRSNLELRLRTYFYLNKIPWNINSNSLKIRKNGQQKKCNWSCNIAANELNSDVARFTTHVQTC